ncbi:MAG: FimV/HubP family polar landmark protein [Cycloclasticus sp.]
MNKPTKAVAAFCLLNTASAYALGVGEIETHSALNQLLNAQIPLVGSQKEDPSNIRIGIASRETFEKAGIDRPHYLTQLKFTPVLGKNGEITVDVRSNTTIKEPFVNFILEVEWPQGRTLKEFTILLDPPITMSDVRTTPLELPKSPAITPTPQAVVTTTTNTQLTSNVPPAAQPVAVEYGPTKNRDTVWGIAKKLIADNSTVTHQQMMLALYDNNPKAFYKKNINALKKGAILQLPSNEQVDSRTSAQANNEYVEQNALWSSSTKSKQPPTAVAAVNSIEQQSATESSAKKKLKSNLEEAKLTLLTPKQEAGKDIPIEGGTTDTPVGATDPNEQANIAIEMATTLEEENKEVKSRLSDLESQLEKLQRLLVLKDEQLAQLQSNKPVVDASPATTPKQASAPIIEQSDNLPLYGGGLAIALLGLFLARRKKQTTDPKGDESFSETPAFSPTITEDMLDADSSETSSSIVEEEPLLSEFTPTEFDSNIHTQEADPLTECDVYIAYGRYQQAEDLISKALETDPDNLSYKLKLLDIHFSSDNPESFEELASSLSNLQESDPDTWNSIAEMGAELNPDSSLFLSPLNEEIEIKQATIESESESEPDTEADHSIEEDNSADSNTNSEFEFDFNLIKNETSLDKPSIAPSDEMDIASTDTVEDNLETKLALAQASIEMEDIESARNTLNEVLASGNDAEKQKAQEMLDNL